MRQLRGNQERLTHWVSRAVASAQMKSVQSVLLSVIFLFSFAEVHAANSVSRLTSVPEATNNALAKVCPVWVSM